jgi:predicted aspartyl protease
MITPISKHNAVVLLLCSYVASASAQVDASAALRAERAATGGQAWKRVGALVIDGRVTEGDVPMKSHRVVDLATGRSRTTRQAGQLTMSSGFDSVTWNASSGIVNSVDVPALVADDRARAFIDRAGWRSSDAIAAVVRSEDHPEHNEVTVVMRPPLASEVALTFDKTTHLLKRAEIEADYGPVVMTFSDWRSVGAIKYPFRQSEVNSTGETTVTEVETVRLLPRANRNDFARPSPQELAHLVNGTRTTVPIQFTGALRSHILIPATVGNTETQLLFDTGAANYFSLAAAKRMGLDLFGGVNISGVGESSSAGGYAHVSRMAIGGAELRDQIAIVGPLPFPSTPSANGRVTEGTAGFEYLYFFRTTIDYPAGTMTFASANDTSRVAGMRVPFYSDGHSMYLEAEVDGHKGLFRLDTGASGAVVLFPTFAARNGLYQNGGPTVTATAGAGGRVAARPVTLSRFSLGGLTIDSLPAALSLNRAGAFASRSLAGSLGGPLLRCYRLTIDYRARYVYFEPSSEGPACARH